MGEEMVQKGGMGSSTQCEKVQKRDLIEWWEALWVAVKYNNKQEKHFWEREGGGLAADGGAEGLY